MLNFILYWTIRYAVQFLRLFFFPLKINGLKNIPKKGPFILACNHRSNLDPALVPITCPRQLNFVAKESLLKKGLFGLIIGICGAIPIKRGEADFSAIREVLRRLKKNQPVLIFPEGTRIRDASTKKVRPGIGLIIAKSRVPVIPVFIKGSDKAMPPDSKKINRVPVSITYGEPINFDPKKSRESIAYGILQKIYELE